MSKTPPNPSKFLTRVMMTQISVIHLVIAYGFYLTDDIALRYASSGIFVLSSVLCLGVAMNPSNVKLVAVTGAATITGYMSRAALVLYSSITNSTSLAGGRIVIILGIWILASLYAFIVFTRGLAPEARLLQLKERK